MQKKTADASLYVMYSPASGVSIKAHLNRCVARGLDSYPFVFARSKAAGRRVIKTIFGSGAITIKPSNNMFHTFFIESLQTNGVKSIINE